MRKIEVKMDNHWLLSIAIKSLDWDSVCLHLNLTVVGDCVNIRECLQSMAEAQSPQPLNGGDNNTCLEGL